MKLTGNISIEYIIHIVRIDLLTSHVPRAECEQKVGQTNAGPFPSMSCWLFAPQRMICYRWSPLTDFDISDSHTR